MRKVWLTAYDSGVQIELLRMGHHNLLAAITGSLVFTPLVSLGTWAHAPRDGQLQWLVLSTLGNLAGWWAWLHFRPAARAPQPPSPRTARQWMWAHGAVMTLKGLAVGSLGALLTPGDSRHDILPLLAYAGSAGYSVAGNAAHDLPAFLISLAVATLLMTTLAALRLDIDPTPVVGLCLLFSLMLTWVALQSHRTIIETISLRLANERLARERAQAAAAAEQASRDKSAFLAAASHDLRQPVHALLLLVEALRQPVAAGAGSASLAPLVDSIADASHAIRELFNGLMDLSRLDSGLDPLNPQPLDLGPLLVQLATRHQALARQRGLALRWRVAQHAQPAWVLADRVLLERVLGNLLANALRHTVHGGVLLSLRPRAGHWQLAVHDSGPGIAAADQQRIFEPYVQLGNAERDRRQGLGLGLAIVRRGVERLGGTLGLASVPGRGSRFALALPMAAPPATPATPLAPAGPDHAALAGRRVLLIDDDPMVRDASARLLGQWGMDLRCAASGSAAALAAATHDGDGPPWQPELLLCDQRLPGTLTGLQLLGELQERWPAAAAVLQTGEPPAQVQALAEEAGYPVLYKPVAPALLASTLRALLQPAAD